MLDRNAAYLRRAIQIKRSATVVVNTGEFAYRRCDGVAVIPLALLGP